MLSPIQFPPFFYVKAFWSAMSLLIAGCLALLAFFGVIPANWAFGSAAILAWTMAVLNLFGVHPELQLLGGKRGLTFPPYFYAKAFWNAVSLLVAGVLGILVFFGALPIGWGFGAAAVYSWIVSVLHFLGVDPQVRALRDRGLLPTAEGGDY